MKKFFRKYILHKYSEQITAIGKHPLFIVANHNDTMKQLIADLNKNPNIQVNEVGAPFLNHIGNITYSHFIDNEASHYQQCSKLKPGKFEESLRKISFKNTFGNNYGFEINPLKHGNSKRLKKRMDQFRWGAIISPTETEFEGLQQLFPDMATICIFEKATEYEFIKSDNSCLRIEMKKLLSDYENCLSKILNIL